MSLINDALRRAKDHQQPLPSPVDASLQPVEYQRRPGSGLLFWMAPAIILLLGFSGWLVWNAEQHSRRELAAARKSMPATNASVDQNGLVPARRDQPQPTVQAPLPSPAVTNAVAPPLAVVPAPPTPAPDSAEAEKSNAATAAAGTPEPPAPKPVFPVLKLQGIIYRKTNPSALINGKTVFIGDRIDNVRVLRIDPETVTLELAGQTNVMRL